MLVGNKEAFRLQSSQQVGGMNGCGAFRVGTAHTGQCWLRWATLHFYGAAGIARLARGWLTAMKPAMICESKNPNIETVRKVEKERRKWAKTRLLVA